MHPMVNIALAAARKAGEHGVRTLEVEVSGPGRSVISTYKDGTYATMSGTSMASPHVAGIVALMAQKDSGLTASEAEGILEDTAEWLDGVEAHHQGAGFVDAAAALAFVACNAEAPAPAPAAPWHARRRPPRPDHPPARRHGRPARRGKIRSRQCLEGPPERPRRQRPSEPPDGPQAAH